MRDQATRLREMAAALRGQAVTGHAERQSCVVAVTSGKGGVGKSNVSVNLSLALQQAGKSALLLDADVGLANADILLGTVPPYHLGHLLRGETDVRRLIHRTAHGLRMIAGGSGMGELAHLSAGELNRFLEAMGQLQGEADYLMVDTGAGLGELVMQFALAADKVVVVTTPEPTSMTDAYATIKALHLRQPGVRVLLVVNMAETEDEGQAAAERIIVTAADFLGMAVEHLGTIPSDPAVPRSVRRKVPFVLGEPRSAAAQAVRQMAQRLVQGASAEPVSYIRPPRGFVERLALLFGRRKSSAS